MNERQLTPLEWMSAHVAAGYDLPTTMLDHGLEPRDMAHDIVNVAEAILAECKERESRGEQ